MLGRNVCSDDERAKCNEEFPEFIEWACKNCDKKKARDIAPRTAYLLCLRRLQKAGFPLAKRDLSLQEWFDLGLINEMIDARRMM